jgi:hypothetical protein
MIHQTIITFQNIFYLIFNPILSKQDDRVWMAKVDHELINGHECVELYHDSSKEIMRI